MTTTTPFSNNPQNGVCADCGQILPVTDMVILNRSWICGACKPAFLQRLAEGAAPAARRGSLWRSGEALVMRRETALPDTCIQCNAPANGFRLKRQCSWHRRAWYLLILAGVLVYAIVALFVRRVAVVHIGLCPVHRVRRRNIVAGSLLAALAGIGILIAGLALESGWAALFGLFLTLGAALFGALNSRIVTPIKIDNEFVWLKGACPAYLDSLADWTGPQ